MEKLSGIVNNITNFSSTSGSINTDYWGYTSGSIGTRHWTSFRVNNTPCHMNAIVNISEGDLVEVVGKNYGEFEVWILNNLTTDIRYQIPIPNKIYYYLLLLIGIPLTLLGVLGILEVIPAILNPALPHDHGGGIVVVFMALIFGIPVLWVARKAHFILKDLEYAKLLLSNGSVKNENVESHKDKFKLVGGGIFLILCILVIGNSILSASSATQSGISILPSTPAPGHSHANLNLISSGAIQVSRIDSNTVKITYTGHQFLGTIDGIKIAYYSNSDSKPKFVYMGNFYNNYTQVYSTPLPPGSNTSISIESPATIVLLAFFDNGDNAIDNRYDV